MDNSIRIRILWTKDDAEPDWNETCAWALEQFGLPGHRFATMMTEEYLDFYFQNSKDAEFFALRWL